MKKVLVVDDEQQVLVAIQETLRRKGYEVATAGNALEALEVLAEDYFQLVLTDVRMPEMDGLQLLRESKRLAPATPVLLLTGHGSVSDAVEALKSGALDYLMKPFSALRLLEAVERAVRSCPQGGGSVGEGCRIVTRDPRILRLLETAAQAAAGQAPVLIEAESGTGKELLARYIHERSPRSREAFVAVNCAALPAELLESELFGHEKGAFTGALQRKPGKFELADGGTLLLDEVGEMTPLLQAKLLRVLQEGQIDPVGGVAPLALDVRVVATTNRDLLEALEDGSFRRDLFYRLNVIPLTIPPLRLRKEDVPLLVRHFCGKYRDGDEAREFAPETLELLQKYEWPGNVRELENVVRRALALCRNPVIAPSDLFTDFPRRAPRAPELKAGTPIREMEKEMIRITLEETGGNRTRAAEMLGIGLRTLRNKLREYRKEGEIW